MAENPRIEELRRRVQADPASIAFAALAEEFRRIGRYEDAIETCRTGLQRHPAYLSARVTLGRSLIETGEYDAAREELETVLKSAPENLAAIRGLAQIHERLGHSNTMDPGFAAALQERAEQIKVVSTPPPPIVEPQPEPERQAAEPEPPPEPEPQPEPAPSFDAFPEPALDALDQPLSLAEPEPVRFEPIEDFPIDLSLAIGDPEPEPLRDALPDTFDTAPFMKTMDEPGPPGPDPSVVAAIGRLERFLDAIQAARHA